MRVSVTGATGFVGSVVFQDFIRAGVSLRRATRPPGLLSSEAGPPQSDMVRYRVTRAASSLCGQTRAVAALSTFVRDPDQLRNRMGSMVEPNTPFPLTASRSEQIFPTLTSAQIARVAKYGSTRTVQSGEILVDQGDRAVPFLVVISGELEVVRPTDTTETL